MKALFVHQNCPGQFKHLAPALAAEAGNEVLFTSRKGRPSLPGVRKIEYEPHRDVSDQIHPYLIQAERAVLHGQALARVGFALKNQGFVPDVMIGNPGWGETLFLKDVWPDSPLISYSEFYYRGQGSDVGFDPEFSSGVDGILRARARTATHLLAIEAADVAYSPTEWQKSQFPDVYHPKMEVIHDGIDCEMIKPDPDAVFQVPNGPALTRNDEVLTYLSRNLEPYRGFHIFMRALPAILEARPNATVVIVGGDDVSYGSRAPNGKSWREVLLEEIGPLPDRVHFTGRIPYDQYLKMLQVTSAHVYLTYPFVLSWSMLEAMASGALVVGSATAPVQEVIEDDVNGRLTDFFDTEALAAKVADTLERRHDFEDQRKAARQTVLDSYEMRDCMSRQLDLIRRTVSG